MKGDLNWQSILDAVKKDKGRDWSWLKVDALNEDACVEALKPLLLHCYASGLAHAFCSDNATSAPCFSVYRNGNITYSPAPEFLIGYEATITREEYIKALAYLEEEREADYELVLGEWKETIR